MRGKCLDGGAEPFSEYLTTQFQLMMSCYVMSTEMRRSSWMVRRQEFEGRLPRSKWRWLAPMLFQQKRLYGFKWDKIIIMSL